MIDKDAGVPLLDAAMSLILAIRAFFAILFGLPLPDPLIDRAIEQSGAKPQGELPPFTVDPLKHVAELEAACAKARAEGRAQGREEAESALAAQVTQKRSINPEPDAVAVRALSIFQAEGRLLDFLSEDIDAYGDAEVGAAVREIHRGCRRALADHFKLMPVRAEAEESMVTVPEGYDPAEIRLVGNVVGRPPFSGTLKHKGWRVEEVRLPNIPEGKGSKVVVPAEVEV